MSITGNNPQKIFSLMFTFLATQSKEQSALGKKREERKVWASFFINSKGNSIELLASECT